MDSLTHLVSGGLTPMAIKDAPKRFALIVFGILAGELPDWDFFLGDGSPSDLLMLHRGFTHAVIFQPVFALVLTMPFYYYFKSTGSKGRLSFFCLFFLALFAQLVHLFLDCMTTFGTQVFLPFSSVRVWFASMFIIDPFLLLPLLVFWFLGLKKKPVVRDHVPGFRYSAQSRRLALWAFIWLFGYPLGNLAVNHMLAAQFKTDNANQVVFLTDAFTPFVWKVVQTGDDGYVLGTYVVSQPLAAFGSERHRKVDPQLYAALMNQEPLFQQFGQFCTIMAQNERAASGMDGLSTDKEQLRELSFYDLRYVIPPHSPLQFFGLQGVSFVLEARIRGREELVAFRFLYHPQQKDTPWIPVRSASMPSVSLPERLEVKRGVEIYCVIVDRIGKIKHYLSL